MGVAQRRDLFLQIGGSASGLETAAKAGRTALLNLGTTAEDIQGELQRLGEKLDTSGVEASARDMEKAFDRTFATIRANARKVMDAPSPAAASQILNVTGAERAARAAEVEAAAMRKLADASVLVAARGGDAAAEQRVLAVGFGTAAAQAEQQATALRQQADVLAQVAAEAGIVADADEDANRRIVKGTGQAQIAKAEFQHVLRSASDSYAAGLPPMQIFTMELGRLAEAAAFYGQSLGGTKEQSAGFTEAAAVAGVGALEAGEKVASAGERVSGFGGKLKAVGEFMGGPWGLATTMAIAVIAPFIAKVVEGSDALGDELKKLEDNAEKTDAAEHAKRIFAQTEAGIAADIRAVTSELDKQNEALRTNAERLEIKARTDLAALQAQRPQLQQQIQAAQSAARVAAGTPSGGVAGTGSVIQGQADGRVADLQAKLAKLDVDIVAGEAALGKARISLAAEQGKRSPTEVIGSRFDAMEARVLAQAEHYRQQGRDPSAAVAIAMGRIEQQRQAALKAEQDRASATSRIDRDDQQSGRQISLSDAESIVRGIGGRITSAERDTGRQQVLWDRYQAYKAGTGPWAPLAARPGTSEHERGQALDIAKGGGMSLARIVGAFRAQGVHLTERLDEGDHFHVAWGSKGKRGPSAETLEHRQQAADDKAARDAQAIGDLRTRAQEEALRLQRQQITGYAEGATLDRQAVDLERDRLNAAVQLGVATRRWSQAEADGVITTNNANAELKRQAIDRAELSAKLAQVFTAESHARDGRDALLQIDLDMASTRKDRLSLEQQLLADAQAERRQRLYAIAIDPKSTPEAQAQASADLDALPTRDAAERQQLGRRYQGPLDGYRDELSGSVGDMNDALAGLEVTGLKGLESSLDAIVSKSKTVAQAVKGMVASILTDAAHLLEERLILTVLGLSGGGKVPGFAGGGIPGFAGGGEPSVSNGIIRGAGTGTSDSILAMVGRKPIRVANGEAIVTAKGVQKHWPIIDAINHDRLPAFAAGGMVDPASISMRPLPAAGSLTRTAPVQVVKIITEAGPYFDTRVIQTTAPMAQAAMAGGAATARQDASDDAYARIPM